VTGRFKIHWLGRVGLDAQRTLPNPREWAHRRRAFAAIYVHRKTRGGDIRIGQMTESTNPDCLPWNKPLMPSSLPAQYHSLRASLARRTDQPAQERDLYDEEMEISPVKDANGDVVRYIAIKRM
jgi:hypothetical protein